MKKDYLESVIKQFEYYKMLGEKAMAQMPDEKLFWQYNEESNSVYAIVKHLSGNMLSRWTDFLTIDGEKKWRNRDAEFENDARSREELMIKWNDGWDCLLGTLRALREDDLEKIVYIRNQGHTVMEAINRQLAHYPYHVGQIVYIAKMAAEDGWKSLSIPRGNSQAFNAEKFAQPKSRQHFTDELLKKNQKQDRLPTSDFGPPTSDFTSTRTLLPGSRKLRGKHDRQPRLVHKTLQMTPADPQ